MPSGKTDNDVKFDFIVVFFSYRLIFGINKLGLEIMITDKITQNTLCI